MRLLLAEDERSLSRALAAILEKNHYFVDVAYDGAQAWEYLESGDYDGVILDIMMPKMDGITVLKKLREKGRPVPVLMLTAKSEVDDKVLGLDSGANDYLTKPFNSKELLARIRAMIRSQEDSANIRMQVGNIVLDRAALEVSSPTASFRLANKEFQALELLMSSPGHLISTGRFKEKVWGGDSGTEDEVVQVYISYLRKKLEALHANVHIIASGDACYSLELSEGA